MNDKQRAVALTYDADAPLIYGWRRRGSGQPELAGR
jgi:hypothetical protein